MIFQTRSAALACIAVVSSMAPAAPLLVAAAVIMGSARTAAGRDARADITSAVDFIDRQLPVSTSLDSILPECDAEIAACADGPACLACLEERADVGDGVVADDTCVALLAFIQGVSVVELCAELPPRSHVQRAPSRGPGAF
jgi:hypothetical protein